jgi:hypothetical protein
MPTSFILIAIAMFLTLAVLVVGVFSMAKGGEFNEKYGNKLMQARVICQGVAILLFILAFASN